MMVMPIIRGYDQARDFVFNADMDNQQYQAVVDYLLKQNWEWGTNEYFDHASDTLVERREIYYIKQLWHGALAAHEQNISATKAVRGNKKSVEKALRISKQTGKSPPRLKKVNVNLRGSLGNLIPWKRAIQTLGVITMSSEDRILCCLEIYPNRR